MWVYQKMRKHKGLPEPSIYVVGWHDPKGNWHTDNEYDTPEEAAVRCAFLNGKPIGQVETNRLASATANEITFSVKIPDKASKLMELATDLGEALKKFKEDNRDTAP